MAIIIEDGSAKSNAQSYASFADWTAYWTERDNVTALAMTVDVVEPLLVISTAYIDARYREEFQGRKLTKEQSLIWPRVGVVIDGTGEDGFLPGFGPITDGFIIATNEIPKMLKDAVIELGYRASTNTLAPDIAPGGAHVKRKKVGPIDIEYDGVFNPSKVWVYVDMLLSPLLEGSEMSLRIVRS